MLNRMIVSARAAETLRRWRRTRGDRHDPALTNRQRLFLRDYCQGSTLAEIAAARFVSAGTVRATLHDGCRRLGISGDRRQAKGLICWCIGVDDGQQGEVISG